MGELFPCNDLQQIAQKGPTLPLGMGPLTMSSREIAELVGSRHDTVKVTIERLAVRGLVTFTAMTENPTRGRPGTIYLVGKRDSYVVVAQLSPEFTAAVVKRWQDLEAAQSGAQALGRALAPAVAAADLQALEGRIVAAVLGALAKLPAAAPKRVRKADRGESKIL